jgi:type II secretory pathway pseudopilin PulG
MMRRRLRQSLRARLAVARSEHDRGFSTLEAVVVIPVVVILTMLVVQYVMLWHARNVTEAAAQDALRVARGYEAAAAQGQAAGTEYLHNAAGKLLEKFTVTVDRGPAVVTVHVHGTVTSVVPFGTYTVDESASGPVEKYVTGA